MKLFDDLVNEITNAGDNTTARDAVREHLRTTYGTDLGNALFRDATAAAAQTETVPEPGTRDWAAATIDDFRGRLIGDALWLRTEGDFDRHPSFPAYLAGLAAQLRDEAPDAAAHSTGAARLMLDTADLINTLAASPQDIRTARDQFADTLDRAAATLLDAHTLIQCAAPDTDPDQDLIALADTALARLGLVGAA
jgi:hypothetical protein